MASPASGRSSFPATLGHQDSTCLCPSSSCQVCYLKPVCETLRSDSGDPRAQSLSFYCVHAHALGVSSSLLSLNTNPLPRTPTCMSSAQASPLSSWPLPPAAHCVSPRTFSPRLQLIGSETELLISLGSSFSVGDHVCFFFSSHSPPSVRQKSIVGSSLRICPESPRSLYLPLATAWVPVLFRLGHSLTVWLVLSLCTPLTPLLNVAAGAMLLKCHSNHVTPLLKNPAMAVSLWNKS